VSMGPNAARHCREILENVQRVVAIELMTAAQGVDLRADGPGRLGRGTAIVHEHVRERVPYFGHDRPLSPDIEQLTGLILGGELRQAVHSIMENSP